jgi:hypothetical protein
MYQTGYYATGYYQTDYYLRPSAGGVYYTYFALLEEVRALLGDTNELCQRYSDEQMISALNRGLQELARIRPDAFYDLFSANSLNVVEVTDFTPTPDQTFWGDAFNLDLRFWPPLVYFVVSQMDLVEDEYADGMNRHPHGSRSAGHMRLFRRHVLSV